MDSKMFYTVLKNVDADELTTQYSLTYNGQFCEPIEGIRKNDDGSFTGFTLIKWDKSLATVENMAELIGFGPAKVMNFNNANEYNAWLQKNPLEYDEEGNPILTQTWTDKLKGWLTGWFK